MKKETKDVILFWIVIIFFLILLTIIAYFLVELGWIEGGMSNVTSANMVGDGFGI